jgi:septum formation protein
LGKPQDPEDAFRILKLLSGQTHEVKTAVCLIDNASGTELSQIETTLVHFRELSNEEIWSYVQTGEPMDKAGAYGIQGEGRKFIDRFEGPFDNVVGLPMDMVQRMLKEIPGFF